MTPREATIRKVELAAEYSRLSERLEKIREQKAKLWIDMRAELKTDKAADKAWDASEMGIDEMKIVMAMKRNEKESSALNSYIRVAENEARGLM